jgi:hypothetical protein
VSVAKNQIFEELENPDDCRCTEGDEISSDRSGCRVHWKPNLRTGPGMRWLDEYPEA